MPASTGAPTVTDATETRAAPVATTRFTPGMIIGDRYRIVSLLGEGGMGQVYRADDMRLGQRVALKCLPPALASKRSALLRLFAEVRIGREISHPNVCRVHDIVELEGQNFISMEYIDGEDLSSLLRRIGRLPAEKGVLIAHDICAGLAAAHDRGIVHRDLKPSNIMIDGRGRAVIADFGLAALGEELRGVQSTSGTPAYMAPEQLRGSGVTARSDIYALGLILYEIFTGKRVFHGPTADDIRQAHDGPKTRPSSLVRDMDPEVERMILRCLEEDPALRLGSVHAILAALPRGDPLAAAIAAGDTPSPDVVAAAGESGELSLKIAGILCAAALLSLLLGAWASWRWTIVSMVSDVKSRDVLSERARDVLRAFGYARPRDEAVTFRSNVPYLQSLASRKGGADWGRIETGSASPLLFTYRGSPVNMVPLNDYGYVTADDPPETIQSMSTIVTDHRGRLRSFRIVPPEQVPAAPVTDFKWDAAFRQADLDIASFTPAAPAWTPPYGFDRRMAWTGTYPERPGLGIRVEAASLAGKPVLFRVIEPWTKPLSIPRPPPIGSFVFAVITFLSFIGGAIIALRNHRMGRGDTRGAIRIGLLVLVTSVLMRLFAAHHLASFREEWEITLRILAVSLLRGVTVSLLYLAVEPYIRRRWPRLLFAWSRLVAGRMRDPLVGRDVMIGAIAAGLTVTLSRSAVPIYARLGISGVIPMNPFAMPEMNSTLAFCSLFVRSLTIAIVGTAAMLTLIVLFALITRSYVAALSVTLLLFVGFGMTGNVPVAVNALQFGALLYVLHRFGAVAYTAAETFRQMIFFTPMTFDLSAWYATRSVLVLLVMTAIVAYGFHLSLAGKPIFRDAILEQQPVV